MVQLFGTVELKLLVDVVQFFRFLTQRQSAVLIDKLCRLTNQEEAKNLIKSIYVTAGRKSINEKCLYSVDVIYSAILHDHQVTLHYFQWGMDKKLHQEMKVKTFF